MGRVNVRCYPSMRTNPPQDGINHEGTKARRAALRAFVPSWFDVFPAFAYLLVIATSVFAAGPTAVPDSPKDLPKGPPPLPVPLLRADEAIATMQIAKGFRIETVAEEPL